jgi:hypothetical protein
VDRPRVLTSIWRSLQPERPAMTTCAENAASVELGSGLVVRVASLADVIRSNEAAGREKDRPQLAFLRRTLEEIRAREINRQRKTP